jgi:hypothetical protein
MSVGISHLLSGPRLEQACLVIFVILCVRQRFASLFFAVKPRACVFKYTLVNGRTEALGESNPESKQIQSDLLSIQDLKEIDALRHRVLREFTRVRDVLRDGTEVICSTGESAEGQ